MPARKGANIKKTGEAYRYQGYCRNFMVLIYFQDLCFPEKPVFPDI